jgi:hypothetical protein
MKRWIAPLAVGMVVLYAALAIGAANCLVLHAQQPPAHHHSHSHVTHSALCAWACQINPTVTVPSAMPLAAVSIVVARLRRREITISTPFFSSESPSRAPPSSPS